MSDSLVIIPTYNEKENIESIIRKIFSLSGEFHILIVDDGSPDGTAEIVKNLMSVFTGKLFLEERKGKLGLGTAYIHGFKWALQKTPASVETSAGKYQFIFEMDADFSHNPDDLVRLYETCINNNCDVCVGSRYIKGVNVVNWPLGRVLMSYFANLYVRLITGMNVHDSTAGFICYRRKVLETIPLDKIKFIGYAFQIEMKFTAWKYGFKIKEIPITFTDRKAGVSKMSGSIFKEAFGGVLKMKIDSFSRTYKV